MLRWHGRIGTSHFARHIADLSLRERPVYRHTLYLCVTDDRLSVN